ncbi:hypothetical protein ACFQMA_18475 [Halosimplex aquaticum]|uniref:Uncharacterized protein n=1 Tax=Halosimplex aquaticum TaxID=3026162 RepID=A0ABD5Y7F4_9EURY|nr:hypothetical protein [Halosimplex aquaticum]
MVKIDTNISTDGGLFSTGGLEWGPYEIDTPVKAVPVEKLTSGDTVDQDVRKIAQVCVELGPADLEAYRSGNQPQALDTLEDKLTHTLEDEVQVVIFEYTDGHEIGQHDMDTLVELQDQYADIITSPCQPELAEPLMPVIDDGRNGMDRSPFRAFRASVEHFKESLTRVDIEKPIMGVLPPLAAGHQRQILTLYEDIGAEFLAVDFRGLKPTTDRVYDWLQEFIADLAVRGELSSRVLYALNYRRYFPRRNASVHPSEGIALVGSGFDILGETHVSRAFPQGDYQMTNVKAFDPSTLGFRNVSLDNLQDEWPQASTIPPARLDSVGESKRRELRHLANAESLNYGLRAFRAAVQNGEARDFIESKTASELLSQHLQSMEEMYDSARGPSVTGH